MFTSCRTVLIPEGDESKLYIREANMMMSRFLDQWYILFGCLVAPCETIYIANLTTLFQPNDSKSPRCVLLMGLVTACGGSWLLEQPRSSIMGEFFRMQWFCRQIKVTQLIWWKWPKWSMSISTYWGWFFSCSFLPCSFNPKHILDIFKMDPISDNYIYIYWQLYLVQNHDQFPDSHRCISGVHLPVANGVLCRRNLTEATARMDKQSGVFQIGCGTMQGQTMVGEKWWFFGGHCQEIHQQEIWKSIIQWDYTIEEHTVLTLNCVHWSVYMIVIEKTRPLQFKYIQFWWRCNLQTYTFNHATA